MERISCRVKINARSAAGRIPYVGESSKEWLKCIRTGCSDAIPALLLALTSNIEELTLSSFNADLDHEGGILDRKNTWQEFSIGNYDANHLKRLFCGATNSQLLALKDKRNVKDSLSPSVKSQGSRTAWPTSIIISQ